MPKHDKKQKPSKAKLQKGSTRAHKNSSLELSDEELKGVAGGTNAVNLTNARQID